MDKIELKKNLDLLGVNPSEYSLEGDLLSDKIIFL